jgi:signal transduction histidine kinase
MRELQAWAAAVAHDLRTPLSALSGEVELALRRGRSPEDYRDALNRIAERVAELVDLSGDLAVLARGDEGSPRHVSGLARLDAPLASLREYCGPTFGGKVSVTCDGPPLTVAGDELLLARALKLLVDHAVKHRRENAGVRLRRAADQDRSEMASVDLVLDAPPSGFAPNTWHHLAVGSAAAGHGYPAGLIRLRAASLLIEDCGGSVDVITATGLDAVRIRLRRA